MTKLLILLQITKYNFYIYLIELFIENKTINNKR